MDILSNFAQSIFELMIENGFNTNEALASAMNINPETLRSWRNEKHCIRLSSLIQVTDFFHCSVEYLIRRTDTILNYSPQPCPPFYKQLRKLMKESNFSRSKLIKKANIYDSYFTNWKKGADPTLITLVRLADALDCTVDQLIGREK